MAQDHLEPWDLHLNKLGKGQLAKVLKKKIFENFSVYFYDSNLQSLARGHLDPWDLHLNKIGKGPLGNATIQISSI